MTNESSDGTRVINIRLKDILPAAFSPGAGSMRRVPGVLRVPREEQSRRNQSHLSPDSVTSHFSHLVPGI